MSTIDPIEVALELTSRLDEALKQCNKEKKAIPRRANDIASLLTQLGLTPTITFYLSKSSNKERIYSNLIEYLLGRTDSVGSFICEDVSNEGDGYSILLALIIASLTKLGHIKESEVPTNYRKLIDYLKQVRRDYKVEYLIERSLSQIVIEFKKLLNALYEV